MKSALKQDLSDLPDVTVMERRMSELPRGRWLAQTVLGVGAYIAFVLPYLRMTTGLRNLHKGNRYLFVSNHVSLLDTILLGGLCWRSGCYPILVLGDKRVWHGSWLKKMLSGPIGFLLERGKLNLGRIQELQAFARASQHSNLVVYPEGTRGDGVTVGPCQPGLYHIAQEARIPIVPIFIKNMQLVSTKTGRFHPIRGLRKIEVHFGEPVLPMHYLTLSREDFLGFIRKKIARQ